MHADTAQSAVADRPKRKRKRKPTPPEQRRVLLDQRTRVARRLRTIEGELRRTLRQQGRVIDVHTDCMIGNLAHCLVHAEMLRGEHSRGIHVDLEQLTRLANTSQRLVAQLGLKPSLAEEPGPSLGDIIERGDVE
jgi:hypothetical protein